MVGVVAIEGGIELYAGPTVLDAPDDLDVVVRTFISAAAEALLIVVQEIDSEPIASAILAARARKVRIQLIVEGSYLTEDKPRADPWAAGGDNETNRSIYAAFLRAGIDVVTDLNPAIFHQKFIVRDFGEPSAAVLTGSTNFTRTDTGTNTATGAGAGNNLNHVLVFNGRPPRWAGRSPFEALTSNGLAAHTSPAAAVEAALCEVIERHSVSLLEVVAAHGPYLRLAGVVFRLGLDPDVLSGFREDHTAATAIDPETVPMSARPVLASLRRAGLDVTIKRMTGDIDLPTYGVAAAERTGIAEFLACAGYGTRLSHERALLAALLELAQTRATDLQGAREDVYLSEKSRIPALPRNHWLFDPGPPTPFGEEPSGSAGIRTTIDLINDALARAGASRFGPSLTRRLATT